MLDRCWVRVGLVVQLTVDGRATDNGCVLDSQWDGRRRRTGHVKLRTVLRNHIIQLSLRNASENSSIPLQIYTIDLVGASLLQLLSHFSLLPVEVSSPQLSLRSRCFCHFWSALQISQAVAEASAPLRSSALQCQSH